MRPYRPVVIVVVPQPRDPPNAIRKARRKRGVVARLSTTPGAGVCLCAASIFRCLPAFRCVGGRQWGAEKASKRPPAGRWRKGLWLPWPWPRPPSPHRAQGARSRLTEEILCGPGEKAREIGQLAVGHQPATKLIGEAVAALEPELAHGDAPPRREVHVVAVLDGPGGIVQSGVDLLPGLLFGTADAWAHRILPWSCATRAPRETRGSGRTR